MKKYENKSISRIRATFYQEIDADRLKSSCSLAMVIYLLLAIFVLVASIIIYLGWRDTSILPEGIAILSTSLQKEEESPPSDQARVTTQDDQIMVQLREEELSRMIGANDPAFPVKKAKLAIAPQNVSISGKTSESVFSLKITVELLPEIRENKIAFKVLGIKSGSLSAPKFTTDSISNKFLQGFSLPISEAMVLKEIKLYDGYLEIIGEGQ